MTAWLRLLCVSLALASFAVAADPDTVMEEFNIRPNSQKGEASATLHGHTCKFTYAASGGTNEQWGIMFYFDKRAKVFTCEVTRPESQSYLLFSTFSMGFESASKTPLTIDTYTVARDLKGSQLRAVEIALSSDKRQISSSAAFSGSIQTAQLTSSKRTRDEV